MDKDVYEKILSLHENNQKIKDLLEKEANELKEFYSKVSPFSRTAFLGANKAIPRKTKRYNRSSF
ncbi:hypothetical protein SAMN05192532_101218 [Alteribacillus iranensis]|uniref:Uncharacterized protein n=1 Tax=Alteribacillus iranensis TaxID=930128 RepID=A0A1I1ZFM2_9BACI|nr:hypothetical protein SAMN05192532_101218 [Alteribacillus iranensis]